MAVGVAPKRSYGMGWIVAIYDFPPHSIGLSGGALWAVDG